MIRKNDALLAVEILVCIINEFLDFVNLKQSMSANQVIQTARLILEDYSQLKPDDFVLFFNKAKKGHFGVAYNRMDGSVIFEWLERYLSEKNEEIEAIRLQEKKHHDKDNTPLVNVPMPNYVKGLISDLQRKKIVTREPIDKIESEGDKIVKGWIKEFDENSEVIGGKRYFNYNGVQVDVNEYLQIRMNEL